MDESIAILKVLSSQKIIYIKAKMIQRSVNDTKKNKWRLPTGLRWGWCDALRRPGAGASSPSRRHWGEWEGICALVVHWSTTTTAATTTWHWPHNTVRREHLSPQYIHSNILFTYPKPPLSFIFTIFPFCLIVLL